jgi:hypothetical protein
LNNNNSSIKINWEEVVIKVKSAIPWFREHGIKPSLRTMFYRLVSLQIIPNTEQAYKSLSSVTVKARKKGKLAWDSFSDEGRVVIGNYDDKYKTPEQHIQLGIDFLKRASINYTVPRWYKQEHYVEVWIEKLALADTFYSFLKDKQIKIVVNKGYAGWSFLYDNCKRLQRIRNTGKDIHILYFGDFDPSGDDMDRHLRQGLLQFGLNCKDSDNENKIELRRIAVTREQIQEFNLPPVPDSLETINKVRRDTRTNRFIEKYGKLFVVELDALLAIVPDQFKVIVQQSVEQFFDQNTRKRVLNEHPPDRVESLVKQKVRFLDE